MKEISERKVAAKAIILSRVSSREQEEGYSIEAQKHRLQEYCTRRSLEIIKVFEFCESSTITNRTKFMEAINFARSQKEIIAIVTDKVDRLQRSHREYNMLDDLISREKIELHFHTENCIIHKYSSSQDRMMWNVHVMMAQSYVDSLRDNINRSFAHKLRCGEWVTFAPAGYLNVPHPNKERRGTIVVDSERAPLIKKLFEEYATGKYSLLEIVRMSRKWGLTSSRSKKALCRSQLYNILDNHFYYGVMRVRKTGKLYPHIYPPLITKELFDTCQDIRLGRKNKSFRYRGKEYIFKGLVKCATSGRIVAIDTKTKSYLDGSQGQWTYLIARHPDNPQKKVFVREEAVLEEVEKVFRSLIIPKELLEQVVEYIRKSAHTEQDFHKRRISELTAANTKITNRMNRLMDLYMDGDISKAEHEEKRQELTRKRDETIKEIELLNNADNNFNEKLVTLMELASRAYETFKGSNAEEKRQLINFVFSNLKLKGGKLDYNLRPPFSEFVKLPKTEEWWRRTHTNH